MFAVKDRRTSNIVRQFLGKNDVICRNFSPKRELEVELSHAFRCHHGPCATRTHLSVEIMNKSAVALVLTTNHVGTRVNQHSDGFIRTPEHYCVNVPLLWAALELACLHLYLQCFFSCVVHFLKMTILATVLAP